MDIQWSAKRSRSTGGSRRTVQERDAAARRLANLEKKEQEAVEAIQQLGKGAKYDTKGLLPGYVPPQIQKEVTASILLLKMKRGIQKLFQRVKNA
jgi:hypothetical protein